MSAQLTQALILEGAHVRLEPLTLGHLDGLCAVGLDSDLWRWESIQKRSRKDMETYVQKALDEQKRGVSLPFATIFLVTGQVIGSTRHRG